MTIKCRLCGKLGSELQGAYLTRVNEKGDTGIVERHPVGGVYSQARGFEWKFKEETK